MATKADKCKKCPTKIEAKSVTGLCIVCLRKEQEAKRLKDREARDRAEAERAARLAAGEANDLDLLKRENVVMQAQLTNLRGVVRNYEAAGKFEDRLVQEVVQLIERSPYRPVLKPYKPGKIGGKATEHEMLLNVSDAHFPEVVEPQQTFGLSYNGSVCANRLIYLRDKTIRFGDLRRASYPIRKLTVNVNGDMLSGDIHEELEVTNETPISESMVKMSYMLLDMGLAFRESFPEVEFIIMPGNHPRITKKPRYKQKWNNWEWVMGKMLQALAGNKFQVTVPKDLVYRFNIFEQRIGITHGDGQKVQSYGGIPFYGMERRRTKLQSLLKQVKQQQLDMLIFGHFHQLIFEEGQGCSMLINGSIKGGDEFTTGSMFGAQDPVQALLTFHPRHGMTDLSRINLGHIQE